MTTPAYETRFAEWLRQNGMRWERLRYARAEAGGEVAAHRLMPGGEPRGRVVAAHGTGNDALFPQIGLFKALLSAGYEVFAFDLDGHGRHSTTRFAAGPAAGAVGAAVAVAEAGGAALPLHLIGHSLGGALVLDALTRKPWAERVQSAGVISAPVDLRVTARAAWVELRGFLVRRTLREREHYGWAGLVPALGPWKRGQFPVRLAEQRGVFGYIDAVARLLREMNLLEAAAGVRTPVLLVYGEQDRLVPPEQGQLLAERLPRASLLLVPGATHFNTPFADQTVSAVVRRLDGGGAVELLVTPRPIR